jgi:hypothetical protein
MILYLLALALLLVAYIAPELALAGQGAIHLGSLPIPLWLVVLAASAVFLWLAISLLTRKEKDHTPPSLATLMRTAMLFLLIVYLAEAATQFSFRMNRNRPELLVFGTPCFVEGNNTLQAPISKAIPMSAGRMASLFAGAGIGLAIFIWILMRPISLRAFGALALAGAILLRLLWFQFTPIDFQPPSRLPQAQAACRSLLQGEFPYRNMDWGTHQASLHELPGAWLPYTPLVGLGLDLRGWNLLCTIAAFGLIWHFSRELKSWKQGRVRLLATVLILLPPGLWHDANTSSSFFLLCLLTLFLLIHLERWTPAAIVFGLALGTNPFAWVFAPPIGMYLFRKKPVGEGLKLAGWSAGIFLILILPFLLWDPSRMWQEILRPLHRSPHRDSLLAWSASFIGFAALFQWRFLAPVRGAVQWAAVLGVYALAWRRIACSTTLRVYSMAAYLAAVMFNSLIEMHLYDPIFWFLILYLIFKDSKIDAPDSVW